MQRLFDHAAVLELPRRSVLFRKGEQAEFLHVVIAGSIGLAASTEKPERTIVEIFRKDSILELSGSKQGRHPMKIELLESHRSLAARLGMTHEKFSRAFLELREYGVRKTSRNSVQIVAPRRLREFVYASDDARALLSRRARRIRANCN